MSNTPQQSEHPEPPPLAVICLDGDPSLTGSPDGDPRELQRSAQRAAKAIVGLIREGFRTLVVPAGKGAIDRELIRNEEASTKLAPSTMSEAASAAQSVTGMHLENALRNALKQEGLQREVSTLITPLLVAASDEAFTSPSQPVGPELSAWRAREISRHWGVPVVEEVGKCWRRVVATPVPVECLGLGALETLLDADKIVLTAAGGGDPQAIDTRGHFSEVEALLNEAQVATLLANELAAHLLIFMHGQEYLVTHAGSAAQGRVEHIDRHGLRELLDGGAFEEKGASTRASAGLDFLDAGGEEVVITSAQKLTAALAGRAGTRVSREARHEDTQQISLFTAQGGEAESTDPP